ncbi:MAG: MMPL family transporter [Thiohalospira sp.]
MAILVLGLLGDLAVDHDLAAFLPQKADQQGELVADLREGEAGRATLVVLSGAAPERLGEASRELHRRLADGAPVADVHNGSGDRSEGAAERLFQWRYQLSPRVDSERFTAPVLRSALEERLAELRSPLSAIPKEWIRKDPTGEIQEVLSQWRQGVGAQRQHGVWFSGDGEHALLVVEGSAPLTDLAGQRAVREAVDRAAAELEEVEVQLFGPGVLALETADRIRAETTAFSILASLGVALVLLAAYRTAWPLLIAVVPVATALVVGSSAVALLFGGIHGITLAFGITLVGVTLDYPLHLFSHLKGREVVPVVRRLWPTLRLSALSTAIGYGLLATTDLTGLAQLGVFTFTGVLAAAATTRWLLPAFLPREAGLEPRRLPGRLAVLPAWLPPVVAGVVLIGAMAFGGEPWETEPAALSPVSPQEVAEVRRWQAELGVPESGSALFVSGDSLQRVLRRAEALRPALEGLRSDGHLRGFDLLTDRLPSARTQLERLAALPEPEEARRALETAAADLPFRRDSFNPFLEELEAHRGGEPLGPGEITGTALEARVAPFLDREGDGGHRLLIPLKGLADRGAVAEWAGEQEAVRFIDLRTESSRAMTHYRDEALERLALGVGAIALVLAVGLGSFRRALRRLIPVVSALVTTAAALVIFRESLSLFHLMGLALAGGIVMDYALFRQRGEAPGATRHALLVCSISTIGVFGILSASAMPVLQAIGLTVALGVASGLVFTLFTVTAPGTSEEDGP